MRSRSLRLAALAALLLPYSPAMACTGIWIRPKDGSVIVARTMEFAADLHSDVIVIPGAQSFQATLTGGKGGMRWTSKYGVVGANAFGRPSVVDGLNEKGLSVAVFYFPGFADYQEITPGEERRALAPWDLGTYLLGTCADVEEAEEAARRVLVAGVALEELGGVPPCHYLVRDKAGRCVVLEYVEGGLKVHDDPLGVLTNSPAFDWHVTNLRNYLNLSPDEAPPAEISCIKLSGLGQGTGMLGLPGDFTPPSRFVRAVAFTQSAAPVDSASEGIRQAFHILNQFDIPRGSARSAAKGKRVDDYTLWTSAADLTNGRYYFHTYANRAIRMVDLRTLDFRPGAIRTISMGGDEEIRDVTESAK